MNTQQALETQWFDYVGVIAVPEGQSGDCKVVHETKPSGTTLSTGSMRTAFFGQGGWDTIPFPIKTLWHRLEYEGGTWMTDLPIEQKQMRQCTSHFYGDVLVGGLGLGVVANMLAADRAVDRVVIIERSMDVIKLVRPHIKDPEGKIEVLHNDIMTWLNATSEEYDFALYDTWQGDGIMTWLEDVRPLRRKSVGKVDEVVCWNEDVMLGQMINDLRMACQFAEHADHDSKVLGHAVPTLESLAKPRPDDEDGAIHWNWRCPFFARLLEKTPDDVHMAAREYVTELRDDANSE